MGFCGWGFFRDSPAGHTPALRRGRHHGALSRNHRGRGGVALPCRTTRMPCGSHKPHAATLPRGQPLRSPPPARRDRSHRAIRLRHEPLRNASRDTRGGYECRARGVPKVYLPHHPRSPEYALPNGGDPLD